MLFTSKTKMPMNIKKIWSIPCLMVAIFCFSCDSPEDANPSIVGSWLQVSEALEEVELTFHADQSGVRAVGSDSSYQFYDFEWSIESDTLIIDDTESGLLKVNFILESKTLVFPNLEVDPGVFVDLQFSRIE